MSDRQQTWFPRPDLDPEALRRADPRMREFDGMTREELARCVKALAEDAALAAAPAS